MLKKTRSVSLHLLLFRRTTMKWYVLIKIRYLFFIELK